MSNATTPAVSPQSGDLAAVFQVIADHDGMPASSLWVEDGHVWYLNDDQERRSVCAVQSEWFRDMQDKAEERVAMQAAIALIERVRAGQ